MITEGLPLISRVIIYELEAMLFWRLITYELVPFRRLFTHELLLFRRLTHELVPFRRVNTCKLTDHIWMKAIQKADKIWVCAFQKAGCIMCAFQEGILYMSYAFHMVILHLSVPVRNLIRLVSASQKADHMCWTHVISLLKGTNLAWLFRICDLRDYSK